MALTIEYSGFFDDIIDAIPDITKSYFDYKSKQDALKLQLKQLKMAEEIRRRQLEAQRKAQQLQLQQQMQSVVSTGKRLFESPLVWIALGSSVLLITILMTRKRG